MSTHPVFVEYNGARTRIGTANQAQDGSFVVVLSGFLVVGSAEGPSQRQSGGGAPSSTGGAVFPPFGKSKGAPISGASMRDLEFYANCARRTLDDPGKSRFHDKERQLLAAIEAEIERQNGGVSASPTPTYDDSDLPF